MPSAKLTGQRAKNSFERGLPTEAAECQMKPLFKRPFLLLLGLAVVFAAAAGQIRAAFLDTDPAWGNHGAAITDFNGQDDIVSALFLQPDGKLMVAGWVDIYPGDFGVARYLPDGRLDPAFGDGGRLTTAFSDSEEFVDAAWSVNQRRDGGYLVFGETCDAGYMTCELALAAYDADGSLDRDFGTQGLVVTDPGTESACAWPRRSIVQTNGKLVAAGVALQQSGDIDMLLLRYNADGSLDKTFGKKGITIIDLEGTGSYPQDILPLPGNKILVVGGLGKADAGNPYTYDAEEGFLAVFNSSGALDSSFGGGEGYFTWNYKGLNTGGQTALLVDDKLYVMSYVEINSGECGLQRYDLDGRLDTAFGSDGWLLIGGPEYNYCWDLALTPDRKLVFAGETFPTYGVNRHRTSRSARHASQAVCSRKARLGEPAGRYRDNYDRPLSFGRVAR